MDEQKYLSITELQERWRGRISKSTLATWRSQGKGPKPTKIGGKVLYSLSAVQEYEQNQERKK